MQPLSFVYTQNAHKRGRVRKGAGIDITRNCFFVVNNNGKGVTVGEYDKFMRLNAVI